MRNELQGKKKALVDSYVVVNVESLEVEHAPPAPSIKTSGTPTPTPSFVPSSISSPSLTQAMIYGMGNLAHTEDVRASRVAVVVPSMIELAMEASLYPIRDEMKEQHA